MRPYTTIDSTLLTLFLAAAVRAGERPPPPTVPEGFGVNIYFPDPSAGDLERFAEAGFRWARMDLAWQAVEREPGRYDFAAYDRLTERLKRVGARPLFILDYGHPRYDGGLSPHTPEVRSAFARFAAAAAGHFRGRGVCWEIWNESNIDFWKPAPNADDYAKLAHETAHAVRTADPDAMILAPGSSEFPWSFLDTAFTAGLLEHIDAVSVHPYRPGPPETPADDFGRLRALIARHAPSLRRMLPIISSEWGYSIADPLVGQAEQARYLILQWLSNLVSGVNLSIFYDWRDDGDPKEREHRFGAARRNLEPKPSFLAARDLILSLRGYTFRHRLRGPTPGDWTLLFQKGDEPDAPLALASWSSDPKAAESARTPTVRLLAVDGPRTDYRRLAVIRFAAGPLAEGAGHEPRLDVAVVNPDETTAEVAFAVVGPSGRRDVGGVKVEPGGRQSVSLQLREAVLRRGRRSMPLEIAWNSRPLPAIAPLEVWRVDPLTLAVAPWANYLEAVVDNPSGLPFQGRPATSTAGVDQGFDFAIARGQAEGAKTLPRSAQAARVQLLNERGGVIADSAPGRFEPIRGPGRSDLLEGLDATLYVDNAPGAPSPLGTVVADDDGRIDRSVKIFCAFDRGCRYLTVGPRRPLPIPEGAREAAFWIKGNRSGDHLRCRFADASGQTFQPDLGRLHEGWRLARVPLDGSAPGGRWGGANDGVAHPPLSWQAVVLIDSADKEKPHADAILFASPSYRFDQ